MKCTSLRVAGEINNILVARFIQDRIWEHINNENSSVKKKNMYSRQNEDYKGIEVKIIMSENDPANLRL